MKTRNWLSKAELLEIDLNTSPDRYNVDIRQITQMSLWSSYFYSDSIFDSHAIRRNCMRTRKGSRGTSSEKRRVGEVELNP